MNKIFLALSLVFIYSCGPACDEIENGACVIYNNFDIDSLAVYRSSKVVEAAWSDKIGAANFYDLATNYRLVIYFEDEETFGHDDWRGYFHWNEELQGDPTIHIKIADDFDDYDICLLDYVLGHEMLHFFDFMLADASPDHGDKRIWELNNLFMEDVKNTVEYIVYVAARERCD